MVSFLSTLQEATPDPFFILNDLYSKDPKKEKVNIGIGIYRTEEGKTPLMSVFLDELVAFVERARAGEINAGYLGIEGLSAFRAEVPRLVLSDESRAIKEGRVQVIQSLGGTGGMFLGAKLLAQELSFKQVFVSDPTWSNHMNIFDRAGFQISTYPYRDIETNELAFDRMLSSIKEMPRGSVILFHPSCHNPTGIDPTEAQWAEILDLVHKQELFPFFDCAYQGLGEGVEEDVFPIRAADSMGLEFLVAVSFSKNLSLYQQRLGALMVVGNEKDALHNGVEVVKARVIRASYSNPPALGATGAAAIMLDDKKKQAWFLELKEIRDRLKDVRGKFVSALSKRGLASEHIAKQKGMFSYTGLSKTQVLELRDKYSIYMTTDGRANLAGLNSSNIDYVADAISSCSK